MYGSVQTLCKYAHSTQYTPMGVWPVPRDFAFDDSNAPHLALLQGHIELLDDLPIPMDDHEEFLVPIWFVKGPSMPVKLCGG